MKPETLAIHFNQPPDKITGSITAPIYLSTTFERDQDGEYSKGYAYIRDGNPGRNLLESLVTKLEGGCDGIAFASGMAAISACLQSLKVKDHVIFPDDLYFGVRHLLEKVFSRWGLEWSFVDMSDINLLEGAVKENTKAIWIETPSNPLLKISDISSIARVAHDVGAICICDNTWPTPLLQKPFEFGVDLIVHSSTKYFGGHSDVMGGIVITREKNEIAQNLRDIQREGGAVPSPYDCWLVTRGIQTLSCRIATQCDTAEKVAYFLAENPNVDKVYFPGLVDHPNHELSKKQMKKYGAMLSFTVPGGRKEAMNFASRLTMIKHATSLGGTHTLIEHRESVEGPNTLAPSNLLRLSVGLENAQDLIGDLKQAFTV